MSRLVYKVRPCLKCKCVGNQLFQLNYSNQLLTIPIKIFSLAGVIVHVCNSSTQGVEVGGPGAQGLPGLHNSKALSYRNKIRQPKQWPW